MFRPTQFLGTTLRGLVDPSGIFETIEKNHGFNIERGAFKYTMFDEKIHLEKLSQINHMVCLNTRQQKYYLWVTMIEQKQYIFLIHPKEKTCVLVRYKFDPQIYKGTLLEGEIMTDGDGQHLFLISDLLILEGVNISKISLKERIDHLQSLLKEKYNPQRGQEICRLEFRDYVSYEYIRELVKVRSRVVSYTEHVSGLIFKPDIGNQNVVVVLDKANYHRLPLERDRRRDIPNKPRRLTSNKTQIDHHEHPSINFLVCRTDLPDVYKLKLKRDGQIYLYGTACVPNIGCSTMLRREFSTTSEISFHCRYHEKFHKWFPTERSETIDDITEL